MSDSGLKFIIFRDLNNGYRWRLRSANGETLESSARGHRYKGACRHEVLHMRDDKHPDAQVRDLIADWR